ncbi:serine/threonine-protein kinase [Candidatus Uabimicrobium amorphum]|uniref:non-specific serine/threonine protein kinase n=1 Tax=Uabimicrobium amorphum TaxID=2596890 RepID=A0A5S9IT06_UABAM|nr:serine/threonine-protein kinase [Candidatus Uabimicrobium amorphum]BBM87384.1 serine/threonine-protein kinase PknB [Candidatus Uabimicrobium amorphum]
MNTIFIRRKVDGSIKGPIAIDFAFEQLKQQQSFSAYQVSEDQSQWHEAQTFFQMYMQQILKETKRLSMSQKMSANRMGKYILKSELGRGGMGVVYLAYDPEFDRKCAIKVLLSSTNARANKRFMIEARAMARLQHKNIANIYDIQEHPKRYFAMEYVEGSTLKETLENKHITLNKKLQIFCQICDGVAYAHRNKIIHRDLKPINILLDKNNVPKILDFGIAKQVSNETEITKTGEIIGTPKYLAPEVIKGGKASFKSDLYSLAVIFYEILTGNSPFVGDSALEIMYAISIQTPPVPSEVNSKVPIELDLLCMKCLDKDPEHRLQSVAFLRKEIERFLNNKPILTKKFSYVYRAKKWVLRNPYQTVLGITLMAVCVILSFAWGYTEMMLGIAEEEHRQAHYELMDARFEAAENLIKNSNFYDAFHKLGEVYNDQQKFSQREYIHKANFLLKYSILPSLPQVRVYPKSEMHIHMSPLEMYFYSCVKNTLYLWKNVRAKTSLQINDCWWKIPVKNADVVILFTSDARYLVVYNKKYIEVFDTFHKKEIFSLHRQRNIGYVQIANNGKYIAYAHTNTSGTKEVILYEIESRKAHVVNKGGLRPQGVLFSSDSKWLLRLGVHENVGTKYEITIYNVRNHRYVTEVTYTSPRIKFSQNNDILYVNNRRIADLTKEIPRIIPPEKTALKHLETDKDYLVLENVRIYQQSGKIIYYDELSNTKTQFPLEMPEVQFDFSHSFLLGKSPKGVALWSTDSNQLCYYYRDEKQPHLSFIPRSNTFYVNSGDRVKVYELFGGVKNIDFLEKTVKSRDKTLRIQFGENKEQHVVVDSSNAALKQIKKQVKNKESLLFSTINIYNEHRALCNENFIAVLAKGSIIIYDRKTDKRFYFILPGSRFITAGIDEEQLYYIRRDHLGLLLGKISLQQLLVSSKSDIVGRERRLAQDGYTSSKLVFYKENIITNRRDSLVIFDKNLQKRSELKMMRFQDFTRHNDRIYLTRDSSIHVCQIQENELEKVKSYNLPASDMRQITISSGGDYIAIANRRGQHILLGQIKNDQIVHLKKIHGGNNRLLLFHPQRPILAIFDTDEITLYDCEKDYRCLYRKGLALGRIVTFDPQWEFLVTEMPQGLGVNLFPMKAKQENYQDFINTYKIPTQEIFDY